MTFCQHTDREKINHGVVKNPIFLRINAEAGIESTGLPNTLANSIPLSHFPYLLLLLIVPEVAIIYILATMP